MNTPGGVRLETDRGGGGERDNGGVGGGRGIKKHRARNRGHFTYKK